MRKKNRKPSSLKDKMILIFAVYLLVINLYAYIYMFINYYNPSSFSFNSEIKMKNIYETVLPITDKWKVDISREPIKIKADTIQDIEGTVIEYRTLHHQYVVGKDTFSFSDTNEVNQQIPKIVLSFGEPNWNYFDFFYFSLITISTVGYGDILPNSTTIRMIVVTEILIGQFLIIFLLNIVLSSFSNRNEEKEKIKLEDRNVAKKNNEVIPD